MNIGDHEQATFLDNIPNEPAVDKKNLISKKMANSCCYCHLYQFVDTFDIMCGWSYGCHIHK